MNKAKQRSKKRKGNEKKGRKSKAQTKPETYGIGNFFNSGGLGVTSLDDFPVGVGR
jgi:hypothetical protein